jgi:hypothetical protein
MNTYYVLCIMYYVLCIMYYVLCIMYYVLLKLNRLSDRLLSRVWRTKPS